MRKPGKRFAAALGLATVLVSLSGAGTAIASRGLVTGFSDFSYGSSDSAQRASLLDRTVQADAQLVRLSVSWRAVARPPPADPQNPGSAGYQFAFLDPVVRDVR